MQLAVLSLTGILASASIFVKDREKECSVMQRAILNGVIKFGDLENPQVSVIPC